MIYVQLGKWSCKWQVKQWKHPILIRSMTAWHTPTISHKTSLWGVISHHWRHERNTCICYIIPIEKQHMLLYYNWTFKDYTTWHGDVLNSRVDSKLSPKLMGSFPHLPPPTKFLPTCAGGIGGILRRCRWMADSYWSCQGVWTHHCEGWSKVHDGEVLRWTTRRNRCGKNGCGEIRQKNLTRVWQVAARP